MTCAHLDTSPVTPSPGGVQSVCPECVAMGSDWVHLRRCLTCDHVGCCDSSPMRHATGHFQATHHPVITSAEPGEEWRWCYVDQVAA